MNENNVKEVLGYYLKNKVFVIISIAIVIIFGIIYSLNKQPMYKSTAKFVLNNLVKNQEAIEETQIVVNNYLISDYCEIIKSDKILEKVISELNLNVSTDELKDLISITQSDGTNIIKITVKNVEPDKAQLVANTLIKRFKEEIKSIYNIDNIYVIEEPKVASEAYNINLVKDIIIYICIGFGIGFVIITIKYYFDDTMKNVEEIQKETGELPIIGYLKRQKLNNDIHGKQNIKIMKNNLEMLINKNNVKTFVVTSAMKSEGKTYIAENIAREFGNDNKKVLLIKVQNNKKQEYTDNTNKEEANKSYEEYIEKTLLNNVFTISDGYNLFMGMSNKEKEEIIKEISQNFDLILFDADNIKENAEINALIQIVENVILITKIDRTKLKYLQETIRNIKCIKENNVYVVVNGIN